MKILKKRVNDTAIVYLGEKLYTRTGITDEDWLKIVELIEHIQEVSDKPVPVAVGIKQLLELIDENYIKTKKRIEDMMSNIFLSGMVEVNDALRARKGARLVSELEDDFEQDENGFVYTVGLGTSGQLGTEDNISRTSYTKIGNVEIITIPDNLKVKIGDTKEILIIILFHLVISKKCPIV